MGMKNGREIENRQVAICDANYHSAISGRNKVGHIFQQLMSVMKRGEEDD